MYKKINFVAINILSSGIFFSQSLIFLKYMPDNDLGIIMLFQAVIALLGLSQIGLFNGGLRIFSIDKEAENFKVTNNTNVSYILLITAILVIGILISSIFFDFNLLIFLIASLTGGFALLKNWFSNLLIARKKLKEINILNLISAIVSVSTAFTFFIWGVVGALLSIASMYVVFVLLFFVLQKEYLPNKLEINVRMVKRMFTFGFIPYLSGIAVILNNQIDRFFIAEIISLEALGQFFLATAFITVFNLLPTNLNSLFLPMAINSYSERKINQTIQITKKYFLILLLYSMLSTLTIVFLGETVVNLIFPDKIGQLKYLFIMLPGIIAIILSKPFGFILYVALILKSILWSNILSLFSYLSILILLIFLSAFTIENIAYGKTIQGILVLIFLIFATFFQYKKIKNYHFIIDKYQI